MIKLSIDGWRNETFLILVLTILMRIASTPSANLSYLLLAVFALTGRMQAIQALFMSWLFTMLSPGIGAMASHASIGRYAVILGALASVFLRSGVLSGHLHLRVPVLATLGLGAFFVVHSMIVSPMADVSILKAMSWMLVVVTLLSAWKGMLPQERERLVNHLFVGLIVIMVVSLPLLILPLGYLRNGSGFQGILNHPQVFGPTMALLGAWEASKMFAESRPRWSSIGIVGICLVLVILSEARTAGVSLVLGIGIAVLLIPLLSGKQLNFILPGLKSKRLWGVVGFALMLGLLFAPGIADSVEHYISKSGRAGDVQSLAEAYDRSRGGIIDEMMENVKQEPFSGIGFGIASNLHEMDVHRDPFLGLPVSASIEKGVMPLAILEETGLIGLLLVALWLWMLVRRSSNGGVTPLAVTATALLLNMGESTFFSPGGAGLLSLILVTWAFSVRSQQTFNNLNGGR